MDKLYGLFSQKLSKWFVFIGVLCFGLELLLAFIAGIAGIPEEAFGYIITLAFGCLILAGLCVGFYKNKRMILLISLVGFIVYRLYVGFVSDTFGASVLGNMGAPYILFWLFRLFYGIAFVTFIVFVALVYLFEKKNLRMGAYIAFIASLGLGVLYWIIGIVYAADGGGWSIAVLPIFEVGSILMIPGLLVDLLPNALED